MKRLFYIVNTWSESTEEVTSYLEYNGYGKVLRIGKNTFLCTKKGNELADVKVK